MDRLHLRRAEGGRSLFGKERYVQMEVNSLTECLQTSKENILVEVGRNDVL